MSGSLGLGWALNYEAGTNISASKIKGLKNGTNAYSANPFTWFLAGTGYYQVTPKIAANLLVGYRHLTSNQLKATAKYETVKEGELLQDSDGANLEVSSNSLLTSLGITFVL